MLFKLPISGSSSIQDHLKFLQDIKNFIPNCFNSAYLPSLVREKSSFLDLSIPEPETSHSSCHSMTAQGDLY